MAQKRWSCEALVAHRIRTDILRSTITYDTLVRAGVECTSANVQSGGSPYGSVGTSPALVVCSRGVKILPDTTLQPLNAGPVCLDVAAYGRSYARSVG